jgi:hypothetical protein
MTRRTRKHLPRTAEKDERIQRLEQAIAERTDELNRLFLERMSENTAHDIEEKAE